MQYPGWIVAHHMLVAAHGALLRACSFHNHHHHHYHNSPTAIMNASRHLMTRTCWRAIVDAASHELSPAAWRSLFAAQRSTALLHSAPTSSTSSPHSRHVHTSPIPRADSAPEPEPSAGPEVAPDHTSEEDVLQFATPRVKKLAEDIGQLNIIELVDLTEILRKMFKVSEFVYQAGQPGLPMAPGAAGAVAPADDGGDGGAADAAPAAKGDKTAFDIKIEAYDAAGKIKVIKEVRAITGLGLKESKEMVEGLPGVVKKGVPKEEAEKFKTQLEAAGAKVVLE